MEAQNTELAGFGGLSKRSLVRVALLSLITFGIYTVYWLVVTKREMVRGGAEIPTAWLVIVPIANFYWLWKFGEGVEMATKKEMSGGVAFLLLVFLDIIGVVIVQSQLNKVAAQL